MKQYLCMYIFAFGLNIHPAVLWSITGLIVVALIKGIYDGVHSSADFLKNKDEMDSYENFVAKGRIARFILLLGLLFYLLLK